MNKERRLKWENKKNIVNYIDNRFNDDNGTT